MKTDVKLAKAPAGSAAAASADNGAREVSVRVEGVTRSFGSVTALSAADLEIARGEFMTLLGPSGCGKTTLLNLVAGFLEPDDGDIYVGGARLTDTPPHRRNIGMVFQNYALFPHMNVEKNVGYGLKMRGIGAAETRKRVAEALEIVKLTGYGDRRPRELSGGQQQRVALARAIVINPEVLLLDEPLSALDKNLRVSMQIELKEIQRRLGITTIFVTHDQGEALSLSDRIAVMSEGHIQQIGSPEDIYRRPSNRFVASFVGDINRLPARLERVEGSEAVIAFASGRMSVPTARLDEIAGNNAFDVFVRPEHISVTPRPAEAALTGKVARHVYQGGHVDMYVAPPGVETPVLVRVGEHDAASRWPEGSDVGLALRADEVLAFPREA